jgi:hypothetical protein
LTVSKLVVNVGVTAKENFGIDIFMSVNIMLGNLKPHLWEMMADMVRFVAGALEECGVPVKIGTSQLDESALNLFFDRFYIEPTFPNKMKIGHVKYGMVCTEVISSEGIWNYGAERDVPGTLSAFILAIKNAEFVWCLLEESFEFCRSINPNTVVLPFGYLKKMESTRAISTNEKDIDFLMCGLPSDRRKKLVGEISDVGYEVYYPEMSVPVYLRDALMERSKMNLSLQKTEKHNTVSVTRICQSIINKVPVLLEYSGPPNLYTELCITAGVGEVTEKATECITQIDLVEVAEKNYQRLKSELPMDLMMAEVLNATCGEFVIR